MSAALSNPGVPRHALLAGPILGLTLVVLSVTSPGRAQAQDPCPQDCDPSQMIGGCCPVKDTGAACPEGKLSHKGGCVDTCPDGFEPRGGRCRRESTGASTGPVCDAPKELTDDGHCCWPGQVWVNGCSGRPDWCPDGFEKTATDCSPLACPRGQKRDSDGVHCCWPGQKYAAKYAECRGTPKCPRDDGFLPHPESDTCIDGDPDQDGILADVDQCLDTPEDLDGHDDKDGCPDGDNDADGVADESDSCPDALEDRDGFDDHDGCPELDNDRDGLADASDRCPTEPEDLDGIDDTDGCPDLDDDRDGIAEPADRCPDAAEDLDGLADTDGCPEDDADADGVADAADRCPSYAEDTDDFEDEDGCLELHDSNVTWIISLASIGGVLVLGGASMLIAAEVMRADVHGAATDEDGLITTRTSREAYDQLDTANALIEPGWSVLGSGLLFGMLVLVPVFAGEDLPHLGLDVSPYGASLGLTTRF